MDDKRSCSIQFLINHFSKDEREYLMKKELREEVSKYADVEIAIRGRYIPPKEVSSTDSSRQLHFHITGRTKQNLNMAVQKFESLLGQDGGNVEDDTNLEEKITVGIDMFPSIFRMSAKILGEHNENVDYLTKETGAVIALRGRGSGCPEGKDDELHVLIKYKDLASKEKSQGLILNLIETVQQDFIDNYGKYYPRPKKPEIFPVKKPAADIKVKKLADIKVKKLADIKVKKLTPPPKEPAKSTKNVSDDTGSHIEKITLGLKHVPIKFNLKSKIYGPNLSNVKHIETVSSAVLLVEGVSTGADSNKVNSSESPHILVKYLKPELKDMARSLILNLIETIHQEFESLYGAYLEKPESPEILPVKTSSNFSKPSPSETIAKKPPEKSPSPPMRKYPKEDLRPEPRKIPNKTPAVGGPVPPPPPVISKPMSPDYLGFTTNHSASNVERNEKPEPLRSFSGVIEPVKSTYSKVNRSSYAKANPPNISYEVQNIKPIPSIVPPVAGLSSQPLLPVPTSTYVPLTSTYEELADIQQLSDMQQLSDVQQLSDIQPLLSTNFQQYYKRQSNSPVEMGHEPKKFCTQTPNTTTLPYMSNIESIDNYNILRDGPPKAKALANNRYLVELPKVISTPQPAKVAAEPPAPVHACKSKKGNMWDEPQPQMDQPPSTAVHSTAWNPSPQKDERVPVVRPGEPKSVRWSKPATIIDVAALPPRIPASWNSPVPFNDGAPWDSTSKAQTNASQSKVPAKASVRKPVSLKLRGPVKHQINGKPVADGDAVMSFLNECAKSAAARNKCDVFEDSADEDTKSIILIESDEEGFSEEVRSHGQTKRTRTVAVQTDEGLHRTNNRCVCGRFTKAMNICRSISVQTTPFKYGQKF